MFSFFFSTCQFSCKWLYVTISCFVIVVVLHALISLCIYVSSMLLMSPTVIHQCEMVIVNRNFFRIWWISGKGLEDLEFSAALLSHSFNNIQENTSVRTSLLA